MQSSSSTATTKNITLLHTVLVVTGIVAVQFGLSIWIVLQINETDSRIGHFPATLSVIYLALVIFVSIVLAVVLWRKDRKKEFEQPVPVVQDENSL